MYNIIIYFLDKGYFMSNFKDSLSAFKKAEGGRQAKLSQRSSSAVSDESSNPVDTHQTPANDNTLSQTPLTAADTGVVYRARKKATYVMPSSANPASLKTTVSIPSSSPLTEEQDKVVECEAGVIKVKAFAGAGKTFTLTEYAKRRSRSRGLYLAFNRDIKEEALTKFPAHVKCMTSHGLAFPQFGSKLSHKLGGYIQWDMIYNGAGVRLHFGNNKSGSRIYAKLLLETVGNFIASADEMIGPQHLALKSIMMIKNNPKMSAYMPDANDIIIDAEKLWLAMSDPTNERVGATHDVYLKQMQLAGPSLPYDYILLDEAQDSNPAILDLVQKQSAVQVLVGDPHQAIYSFRKAVDAMTNAKADETLELTTSFRFGENVADFANAMLLMKGETSVIHGLGGQDKVYTGPPLQYEGKTAYISRVNATLIKQAAMYVGNNKKVYFAGGVESARFDLLEDIYMMRYNKGKPRDPLLASFNSYDEFKQVAEEAEEVEWTSRCKLVEEMGISLINKLETIKKRSVDNPQDADQIFSTAHKSKGLQFENVILADDFYKSPANKNISDRMVKEEEIEEVNIHYVAATRAMKNLNIPSEHHNYWESVNKILAAKGNGMLFQPAVKGNEEFFKKAIADREKVAYKGVDFGFNKAKSAQVIDEEDPFDMPVSSVPTRILTTQPKEPVKNTLFSEDDPFDL